MVTDAFLSAAATVADLLRSPALATSWRSPSALAEFRVSGLAGHLARGVFTVERYLAAPAPAGGPTTDAAGYFVAVSGDPDLSSESNRQIRDRGELDAGTGPDDLAGRYDAALARLAAELPGIPPDRPMPMVAGHVLSLSDCLLTRLVELLVHADDLAVSIGVAPPAFADEPAELVVSVLARAARRRHGTAPVLRALARRERALGSISAF
jgi:Mycothiol maleylpyruvate isomerase N-terminal domain